MGFGLQADSAIAAVLAAVAVLAIAGEVALAAGVVALAIAGAAALATAGAPALGIAGEVVLATAGAAAPAVVGAAPVAAAAAGEAGLAIVGALAGAIHRAIVAAAAPVVAVQLVWLAAPFGVDPNFADSVVVASCRAKVAGACRRLTRMTGPQVCQACDPDYQIFATLFALIFPAVQTHCSRYFLKLSVFARCVRDWARSDNWLSM